MLGVRRHAGVGVGRAGICRGGVHRADVHRPDVVGVVMAHMTVSSTVKSSVKNLVSVDSTHLSYFREFIKRQKGSSQTASR